HARSLQVHRSGLSALSRATSRSDSRARLGILRRDGRGYRRASAMGGRRRLCRNHVRPWFRTQGKGRQRKRRPARMGAPVRGGYRVADFVGGGAQGGSEGKEDASQASVAPGKGGGPGVDRLAEN